MINYVDPVTKQPVVTSEDGYSTGSGTRYKIVNGIPRFVQSELYASAFGLQWRKFRKTQLDSYTGTTITEDRLKRICKNDLSLFRNRTVLEIGCGAGRFSEIMLNHGAHVHATDLSSAVEASFQNFKAHPNYQVCQADLRNLPYALESFDIVVCLGVIQHTPSPEKTIAELAGYLKRGGYLLIDHYTNGVDAKQQRAYNLFITKALLRAFLITMPRWFTIRFCRALVWTIWPAHRVLFKLREKPLIGRLSAYFRHLSPVHDYQDSLPQLGPKMLFEWAVLDTHDAYTDKYKHMRSAADISKTLEELSFSRIDAWYGGNGVEVMAVK